MKQYNAIKAKYPDALLLFRVGDFYETFGKDAIKAAREQWSEQFIGAFDDRPQTVLMVVEANTLIPFFC